MGEVRRTLAARASAPAPPLPGRGLLRRRRGEHVPDPPVVQAARRAGEDLAGRGAEPQRDRCSRAAGRGRASGRLRADVRDLETFIATQDIRVVLYVNQNTRNFQMFRYGRRWHVFINHGESDKMYMTTNQYKAYDFAFIAGAAARERLGRVLWDYDLDRRTIEIGRPQADHYSGALPYTPDDRTVVLYAPTWEGDRPSAHYGSIRTHGEALVAALLATRAPPGHLPSAPAVRRGRRGVRRGESADHRGTRRRERGGSGIPPRLRRRTGAGLAARRGRRRDRRHLGDGLRPARRGSPADDHAARRPGSAHRHARVSVGVRVAGCRGCRRDRRARPTACSATPTRSRASSSGSPTTSATRPRARPPRGSTPPWRSSWSRGTSGTGWPCDDDEEEPEEAELDD